MRECTQETTAVPILKDENYNHQLKHVIRNTELTGTYESVAKQGGGFSTITSSLMKNTMQAAQ